MTIIAHSGKNFITLTLLCLFVFPLSLSAQTLASTASTKAYLINIDGAIGPATKEYFVHSLNRASNEGASLLIVKINTPGGLDSSMRDINSAILASPIPVAIYVAPSGARAASAGTYMLYASHIAAMAPATNLGAATPVQIGDFSKPDKAGKNDNDKKPSTNDHDAIMSRKMTNDASAYIRGLAELRGRNQEWAESAVRNAESLSAKEALKQNVIDIIAKDVPGLLRQIDGRKVKLQQNELTLNTKNVTIEELKPNWRNQLLAIITDPNIAYILMLVGIYGLIFEFSNPGAMLPGIAGAICLLLALFAFQTLPINFTGFTLIILGLGFMIAEAFVPSFGALGIGGVIAFVIGSIMLMDTDVPGFGVSLYLIGTIAAISGGAFVIVLVLALKARRRPIVSGQEELIGATAEAVNDFEQEGYVHLHGENWHAISEVPVKKNQPLIVTKMDGLTLYVMPAEQNSKE